MRETSKSPYQVRTPQEAARKLKELGKQIAKEHPKPKETSTETLRRLRGWSR
jgi:hypothetical protein